MEIRKYIDKHLEALNYKYVELCSKASCVIDEAQEKLNKEDFSEFVEFVKKLIEERC